jgi:hypothetical protein
MLPETYAVEPSLALWMTSKLNFLDCENILFLSAMSRNLKESRVVEDFVIEALSCDQTSDQENM